MSLIVLAIVIHRGNFRYGLVGNDTYSQILTSRVQSVGDLLDTFRTPLGDGLVHADFYRPVQSLSIASSSRLCIR